MIDGDPQVSRPKWLRWALVAAGAVVVIVVAGLIVIRLVQGGSKPPLSLPSVTTTPAVTGATTASTASSSGPVVVDGVWQVGSGSTAGYRIKETLFGQSNTAIGRTNAVTGNITIAGTTVSTGSFSVDLTKVSSDRSQRDGQFQGRIMDTASFPTATFKLTKPIAVSTLPANGVQVTAMATGDLNIHGVTRSVTFPVTAQRNGSVIQVQGSIPITFADYNISNPSGGPATTGDSGSMEFLLSFSHS
jgi:polyisoprenoid-binding protein YceI